MSVLKRNSSKKRNLPAGNILSWEKINSGLAGFTENAKFEILIYSPSCVRVRLSRNESFSPNPYSVVITPTEPFFETKETKEGILLKTEKIDLEIKSTPFHLIFKDKSGKILNQDDPSLSVSWLGTEVSNYKKVQPGERFIGLGEKTGNLDRSGNAYTNWNTDYFGYGVGDDPLYMSIPFYIGIHQNSAYGIFFDNTHKSIFNFGASNRRFIYYSADDGDMDYYFIHESSVGGIISTYSELTGKMPMPPLWSLGFQQCRYSYYPSSEVLTLSQTFRDKYMPADVIYLDIHHMEKYKVFTFDGEKFPDAKSMIKTLKERGFRVVVIMDPGIKTEKGYEPFEEGLKKDLFIKYPDGELYEGQVWPGWCAFPDFTNPETRKWWAEKMAFYEDAGVDGYWTDMNEPASWGQFTPNLIDFEYEGEKVSHRKARNVYGMQMARSAQEGILKWKKNERPFVLTRSGFAGIQRYAAAWTGDNVASEEHMLAGVRLINSLGLSGVAYAGYDVGGFAGEASKSLFARWMSIGAFSPFYRAHSMINTNDSEPWAFGEEVEEISRNYMKLRYRLLPTLYSSFYKSAQRGLPIAKSLAVDYSNDDRVFSGNFQNQYLFCDSLLIAPVESTKEICKVFLPKGDWFYLFDGTHHKGDQVIFQDCPLNYLPVYVKGGSIIALQSDVANTSETHDGVLRLHVFAGKESTVYQHYEDDGISFDYQNGQFFKRNILWDSKSGNLTLEKSEGDFASKFLSIEVFVHGKEVNSVSVDGKSVETVNQNVAFLGKLTEFDPLPEHLHPYFEITDVPSFKIAHTPSSQIIQIKY